MTLGFCCRGCDRGGPCEHRRDAMEFTVRLYPREIVYWDDPRHPRHEEQAMAEQPEPLTHEQQAFADRFERETKAIAEANRRQDAIAATGLYCPTEAEIAAQRDVTPLPPPPVSMCGEEFTPRGHDYMIRIVCERERGHEGYHGTMPVADGGTAIGDPAVGPFPARGIGRSCPYCGEAIAVNAGHRCAKMEAQGLTAYEPWVDPTTAAIEAQIAERDRMRAEIADLQRSLDLVHDSDRRGIEMWRAAHPSRALLIPDRARMISWLIEENVKMRDSHAMEHRTHAAAETLLATGQRAGKDEIERLHRQVDELTRQRDEADRKLAANAAQLDTFMRGVAHLSIERMRLEREREERPHIYTPGRNLELQAQLAAAEKESARRRLRFDECEAACWEALQSIPHDIGLPFFTERGPMDVEDAVQEAIAGAVEQVRDQQEQLRIADADRIPLRMDLDAAREELARANACALRMEPVTKAAEKAAAIWNGSKVASIPSPLIAALCELSDADKAYGDACKQAQSDSADPDRIDMPF